MRPALLTWASGQIQTKDYYVFFKSSTLVDADKYVLTTEPNNPGILYANSQGWKTLAVPADEIPHILRDRLLHFSEALQKIESPTVLVLDSRDVVFQSDPFLHPMITSKPDSEWILFCDEGERGTKHEYHTKEIDYFQSMIDPAFREMVPEWTINGGVVVGSRQLVSDHLYLRWIAQCRIPDLGLTDQGILNLLLLHHEKDSRFYFDHPYRSSWVFHGCAMKKGVMSCKIDNDLYRNEAGELYTFCHQWDRLSNASLVRERWAIDMPGQKQRSAHIKRRMSCSDVYRTSPASGT